MFEQTSRFTALLACLYVLTGPALAQSQPAYSSEDVIRHFAEQAQLGTARSLCIGTKDECKWGADAEPEKAAEAAEGFNMTVTFEFGSATLTEDARVNLDQFAIALKDDRLSRARFLLEGHTDAVGSEEANRRLSEQRARSVARYLVGQGVDLAKLDMVGYGESRLADPDNPDNVGNRRVEAKIVFQ